LLLSGRLIKILIAQFIAMLSLWKAKSLNVAIACAIFWADYIKNPNKDYSKVKET